MLFAIVLLAGMIVFALGMRGFYGIGQAEAHTSAHALVAVADAPLDAAIDAPSPALAGSASGPSVAVPVLVPVLVDGGEAVVLPPTDAFAPPAERVATTETVSHDPPIDVGDVEKQWRNGSLLGAGALALFLLCAIGLKIDRRRSFYYTAGVLSLGIVVDAIANGATPTTGMIIVAVTTFVSLVVKGPESARPASKT
jgi:hypothetical protein